MAQEVSHALSGAYVIDALSVDERDDFGMHLTHCAACREEVVGFQETVSRLAFLTAAAPPRDLRLRVLRDLGAEPRRPPRKVRSLLAKLVGRGR
ncbi:MAG TPA: hypothetical protein VFE15_00820 [Marmoricola sp.]|jgi:anti-sigma-K factor RskA|nr:hypothetical protein [Marmoricola sp.]